jgi:hypothetical protein
MDDRELEARLRARLRRRFDGAELPATLRPVLTDVPATAVRSLPRDRPLAWLAAAALIVAVVAGLGVNGWPGIGGPTATRTSEPTASTGPSSRQYIVLPPEGSVPSKASMSIATDVLSLRIRSIGIGTFSSAGGYAITFQLPPDVDDSLVRALLTATGELSFVPLPPEDYGSGKAAAVVGEPLPVDEPELFGIEQIASSGVATHDGVPASVHFDLRPIGADALQIYATGHVGETLAVLVDGRVRLLSVVQGPIDDGRLDLGGPDPDALAVLAAVVSSGTLPEGWRDPRVPIVMPEAEAGSLALQTLASSVPPSIQSSQLGTNGTPTDLTATWEFVVEGLAVVPCYGPQGACPATPDTATTWLVVLDAVTGEEIRTELPAP